MNSNVAAVLNNILILMQVGFEFNQLVDDVKRLAKEGYSDEELTKWIVDRRNLALMELDKI